MDLHVRVPLARLASSRPSASADADIVVAEEWRPELSRSSSSSASASASGSSPGGAVTAAAVTAPEAVPEERARRGRGSSLGAGEPWTAPAVVATTPSHAESESGSARDLAAPRPTNSGTVLGAAGVPAARAVVGEAAAGPSVEIVRPKASGSVVRLALATALDVATSLVLHPFKRALFAMTVRNDVRALRGRGFTSISNCFFVLGAEEGLAAMFRGWGWSLASYAAHMAARRLALSGAVALLPADNPFWPPPARSARVVGMLTFGEALAVSASYALSALHVRVTTDAALGGEPRRFPGGARDAVAHMGGVHGLFSGLGFALAGTLGHGWYKWTRSLVLPEPKELVYDRAAEEAVLAGPHDDDWREQAARRRTRQRVRFGCVALLKLSGAAANYVLVPAFEIIAMRRAVGGASGASLARPLDAVRLALREHWSLASLLLFQVGF